MSEADLRKKVENLGKGNFEQGLEQIYSSFVGAGRFFGFKRRYRTLCDTAYVLQNLGLAKDLIETGSLMDYLINTPTTIQRDNEETRIRIEKAERLGLCGYSFSKNIRSLEHI